jgi:hypothetical protein
MKYNSVLCSVDRPSLHNLVNETNSVHELSLVYFVNFIYRGADKSLSRPGRKEATATEDLISHILLTIIIGGILVLFIYITRLASNEIFSSSNKTHREVGRAKDLSAPRYNLYMLRTSPGPSS